MIRELSAMDSTATVVMAALAAASGLLVVLAVLLCRPRARLFGSLNLLMLLAGIAGAALVASVAMNVLTYQRLGAEQVICELGFAQLEPQRFSATLTEQPGEIGRVYEILGDEWQLDARVIKWTGPATLLGFDALYRLERLGGRYRDVDADRSSPRSVYGLAQERGLDLWNLLGRWKHLLPWLDAYYGSATYLPMADGARYRVSLSQSGLIARPLNQAARDAVDRWR
jgi:hypothetical protein